MSALSDAFTFEGFDLGASVYDIHHYGYRGRGFMYKLEEVFFLFFLFLS